MKDRLFVSKLGISEAAVYSLATPWVTAPYMPSPPTITASSTLIRAAPLRIHTLSHTGKKLIATITQINASSMINEGMTPMGRPMTMLSISGHITARDAIHRGKLIQ